MSYDGIVTRAAVKEMQDQLTGGRINRIHQPEATLLRLDIHQSGVTRKLLLDIAGNTPYAFLAQTVPENPDKPPQFCMVLRKHLQNGRVSAIRQDGLDRVFRIEVDTRDELGVPVVRTLVIELMGKHSNMFLLDENERIIEAMKRISGDISSVRPVYPGVLYTIIPSGKTSLLEGIRMPHKDETAKAAKWLLQTYEGFGPPITREICFRAGIDAALPVAAFSEVDRLRLEEVLEDFKDRIARHRYAPAIAGEYEAFYAFPLSHTGLEMHGFDSISVCAETFRKEKRTHRPADAMLQSMQQSVSRRLERARTKYERMHQEYLESQNRDADLLYADLLSANSHKAQRGASSVTVTNYFDEMLPEIVIPLDPKKNVWQNAQQYYKSFSKQKNREQILSARLPEAKQEITYFQQILQDLAVAETRDEFADIHAGLVEEGVLSVRSRNGKKKRAVRSEPLHFVSSDGYTIYVGKNHRQNDELTMRTAGRDDWFFHAKDVPGSHVIVRAGQEELPERTRMEAAWLASVYSSEKDESHVLVDYTRKKNVRKQKGAKPGQVFYEPYETLTVNLKSPGSRPKKVDKEKKQ